MCWGSGAVLGTLFQSGGCESASVEVVGEGVADVALDAEEFAELQILQGCHQAERSLDGDADVDIPTEGVADLDSLGL